MKEHHHIHIVGIGGAGMSAIARVLHGRGVTISGSDRRDTPLIALLRQEGIAVNIGHNSANLSSPDLVLASSAVPDDNVELVAARQRNLPVLRRPEFLGELTAGYDVIAVAGAHGKTTVTGMIARTLLDAGLDPTFIVGGVLADLHTNGRAGSGRFFIIEADEYKNTFLALQPQIAVITNIEFDHPDVFPSLRFVRLSFGDFVDNIREGGMLIACNDDRVAHAVAASYHANGGHLKLYGRHEGSGLAWRAVDIQPNERGGVTFTAVAGDDTPRGEIALQVPGEHNAVNALAVLCVADALGIPWDSVKISLEQFRGVERRFEVIGTAQDVIIVDDYAHHPTQIRAVLHAARQRYPGRRVIAAWEPHTFSRIRALHDEFMTAFAEADHVVVLPIYAAREPDDGTLTAPGLAAQIEHPAAEGADSLDDAVSRLVKLSRGGDVILLLGAGNERLVAHQVLRNLQSIA